METIDLDSDCIDLDAAELSSEELIFEWDAKITKKLSTFALVDNDSLLVELMKDYNESLEEMSQKFDNSEIFKKKIACHMRFFYSYCIELQCLVSECYLNNMEQILIIYCNLELEIIRPLKKKNMFGYKFEARVHSVARRMIHMLTLYLFERHDHILHVLIKMNTPITSYSCSSVLNLLYRHFLLNIPKINQSDESFCRNYIVFQKWKQIKKCEDWEGMDRILYNMFNRTSESIRSNETLKKILMPAAQSPVAIVLKFLRPFREMTNAYFKHMRENCEIDDLDFNIDLGEDTSPVMSNDDDDDEVQFEQVFDKVESEMCNVSCIKSNNAELELCRKYKQELDDDDDDVLFVGRISPALQPPPVDLKENNRETINVPEVMQRTVSPIPVTSAKEKLPNVENLNGITRSQPQTFRTAPNSVEVQNTATEATEIVETVSNQPEVSLFPTESSNDSRKLDGTGGARGENPNSYVYNDYGLTTPPFEVQTQEQEPDRVYANLEVVTKSVEEPPRSDYDDFGLTPPNEVQVDDHLSNQGASCLYHDVPDREAQHEQSTPPISVLEQVEVCPDNHMEEMDVSQDLSTEEPVQQTAATEEFVEVGEAYDAVAEEVVVEPHHVEVELSIDEARVNTDQIDTGQIGILNTAPNIEVKNADTFNGSLPNRTNGQTKPADPPKIVYTQKIQTASLDEFQRFESAIQSRVNPNGDLRGTFTEPHDDELDLAFSSDLAEEASGNSNSPTDMTSPPFEEMDDFRHYYRGSVKKQTEAKTPCGILKKMKKKAGPRAKQVTFDTAVEEKSVRTLRRKSDTKFDKAPTRPKSQRELVSTHQVSSVECSYSEQLCLDSEDEPTSASSRSPSVSPVDNTHSNHTWRNSLWIPSACAEDWKLKIQPIVTVEKLGLLDNEVKRIWREAKDQNGGKPPSSPLRLTFTLRRHASGSMTVKNREHLEKKPEKRKFEPQSRMAPGPVLSRKRGRHREL